jgi:ABC-type lipoprotein export system ATPase subunit
LLLITHDAALAGRCARQLHLDDGRIVADQRDEPADALRRRPPQRERA